MCRFITYCIVLLCCRCFRDAVERLVPNALAPAVNMSIAECAWRAKAAEYTVFALQFGGE